jgi:membrane-associated protease RseP (regulator of RpoE activity)
VAATAPTAAAPTTPKASKKASATNKSRASTKAPASAKQPDGAAALAAALTGDDSPTTAAPAIAAPAAATPTADGATVLARADVSAALSNFGALSKSIQGAFTPDGLRIDGVAASSVFAKAGLQAGDVVTSVDGKPLRSLDDAANVYARAAKAKSLSAQVLRDGKPVALRVAIQ